MIDSLPWWDQPLSRNCAAMLEVAFRRQFSDPKLWLHTFATSPTAPVIIFHLMFHLHQPHPRVINGTRAYHRESAVDRWNRKKNSRNETTTKEFLPQPWAKSLLFSGGARRIESWRCEKIERETARATCWISFRYVRGSTAWSMSQGACEVERTRERKALYRKNVFPHATFHSCFSRTNTSAVVGVEWVAGVARLTWWQKKSQKSCFA